MSGKHVETKHHRIKLGSNISYGKEISQRLGHLLIVNVDKSIVHPVTGKLLAVSRLVLGNLIFMMRENKILTAGMDIQSSSAIFRRHYAALGMPARTSFAPWRIPIRLSHLLGLPKHEVCGAFLLLLSGNLQFAKTGT